MYVGEGEGFLGFLRHSGRYEWRSCVLHYHLLSVRVHTALSDIDSVSKARQR